MKTANFTLSEVAHRPLPSHLTEVGYAAMQYMQAVRNAATLHFGEVIPIRITSGYRELSYNRSIGSSDRSYHIWRMGGSASHADDSQAEYGKPLFAIDFYPVNFDIKRFFEWYKQWAGGECYYHSGKHFIHTSPNADYKQPWEV